MATKTKARRMLANNRVQITDDRAVINPRIVVGELHNARGEVHREREALAVAHSSEESGCDGDCGCLPW